MVNMVATIYCGVAEQLARWMRMGIRMAHCCAGTAVARRRRGLRPAIVPSLLHHRPA